MKLRYLLGKLARDLGREEGLGELPRADRLDPRRVLVLAPHMDDEVIGCGGLLRRWADAGVWVCVAFLTNGAPDRRRHPDLEGLRRQRRRESRLAIEILGVRQALYLDYPDGELGRISDDPRPLRRVIASQEPDVLLVPGAAEYHPDHRATYRWATAAVGGLQEPPRLLGYEVCGNCRPTHVLEIDDHTWSTKLAALRVYRTQLLDMDYCRIMSFVAESRGRDAAFASGERRAEAFRLEAHGGGR